MTEVTIPLQWRESAVPEPTPVFESRFHLSREEQRQLTADTLAYNAIKDTLKTMTDRDEHARVMGIYNNLMARYADPSERKATVPAIVVEQFPSSPLLPTPGVAPVPVFGD
ncbi:MAG: hypothetical protein Q8Q49_05030 [bacterium]|nr:hypothetical protein [bacterium]